MCIRDRHKDTKLQLNELDKKNDIYQAFKKYAQKTDKQVLYSAEPTLVYEDGQPSAYEGNLNVKLDLSKYRGKGYKVLVYRNNQIEELEIDKQMIASKDAVSYTHLDVYKRQCCTCATI